MTRERRRGLEMEGLDEKCTVDSQVEYRCMTLNLSWSRDVL